ncbi:MAG TPA: chemotaxis protein CheX [Gemmataceae bacterium]|nr:chemotaxis protein CheX [Gemmataceae bacterium]
MSNTSANAGSAVPSAIIDAVKASIDRTQSAFFSETPTLVAGEQPHDGPCIAGIVSFLGEMPWSLTWVLSNETAPTVAKKFAGFDIPFESADMGDMVGELVNVIAGEIVAQLEQRKIKSQMSLPTVARGPLELLPVDGPSVIKLEYTSKEGPFWFRMASAKGHAVRIPGR